MGLQQRRATHRHLHPTGLRQPTFYQRLRRDKRTHRHRRSTLFIEQLEDRRLLAYDPSGWGNLGAELSSVVQQMNQLPAHEPMTLEQLLAPKATQWYTDGSNLYVEVRGRGEYGAFLQAIQDAGLQLRAAIDQPVLLAEGFVSLANIPSLASLNEVISVLPVYRLHGTDSRGAASNAAETTLGADVIRNLFGIDGTGVTVGVISDSANQVGGGLAASITTGDLPLLNVGTFLDIEGPPGSSDEGRAMMELIHDIAPGAILRFASGVGGEAAFATAVNTLVSNGANIVVDDLNGLLIEPFFYDGVAAQAVANAVASGVHYFSSAGNRGLSGYETVYRGFELGQVYEVHDFSASGGVHATQRVTLQPGTTTFVFQYDDFWGSVQTDLDFFIFDLEGNFVASGTDDNTLTQVAREIVSVTVETTTTADIQILRRLVGNAPTRWKYIAFNDPVIEEWTTEAGAMVTAHNPGHNAVSDAISVAAANAATPTTPASYSSVGPVTRVFDSAGNRLSSLEIRNKPDVTAHDGVNTTVPGFATFFGTSAAAPNAAALAALVLDFDPSLTPAQLKSALLNGAQDISTPGYDFKTGFGVINGFSTIMQVTGGVLTLNGDRSAPGDNDTFLLRRNGTSLEIELNGSMLASVPLGLVSSIQVNGLGGDDLLRLDFTNGSPIPSGGISFDGGTASDALEFFGGFVTTAHYTMTDSSSGSVNLDGGTVNFTNLEPITDNLNVANRVFTFNTPAVPNGTLTRSSPTMTRIASAASEFVDFTTPTTSLTINLSSGINALNVLSLADDYTTATNTINCGTAENNVNFEVTGQVGANWTVFGGHGSFNLVTISRLAGNLSNLLGNVDFRGGDFSDELRVFDTNRTPALVGTYLVSSDAVAVVDLGISVLYDSNVESLLVQTTDFDDSVDVISTGASTLTTIRTGDGDDTVTVASDLVGNLLSVATELGTDEVIVSLAAGAVGGPIVVHGGPQASGERDLFGFANDVGTSATLSYMESASGSRIRIDGLGNTVTVDFFETVVYSDNTNFGSVVVNGTNGDDLLTIAPLTAQFGQPVLLFNNAPDDPNGPFNGPPEDYFSRLPGVAGGSTRPDLVLTGILGFGGLVISDPIGTNRLYIYGQNESDLVAPGTFDPFGFGPGVILPGTGSGGAYDVMNVSDTSASVNGFSFSYNNTDFVQTSPTTQPAIVVNSGFEGNPPSTSGLDVADDIFLTLSSTYLFQVNGGDPDPTATGIVPPDGDRLQIFTPINEVSVWSNKGGTPLVAIGSPGVLPTIITSIENTSVSLFGGTVNLLGDNNDPSVDQPDHFVVVGRDVDGFAGDGGFQEMLVTINGSAPILIDGVQTLNVFGDDSTLSSSTGNDVDTLELTPYADNTSRGWGVSVLFNEGNPSQSDGDATDLLIYHTALFGGNVSENIVVQPSGPENGEVRVTNAADGSLITTISYVANLDIIIIDDDGSLSDTDTLTLRGTASSTPQASGRELFDVDVSRAGTVADPMIVVQDLAPINSLAPILYRVRSVTGINHITIQSLDGEDVIQVRPVDTTSFSVDGGPPSGSAPARGDILNVISGGDTIGFGAGPQADEGTFYIGVKKPLSFDNIEQLFVDTVAYVRPDDREINDTIAAASVLGSLPQITLNGRTLHGTIGSVSPVGGTTTTDVDFYRITANKTGYTTVNLLFSHALGDLRLDIADSTGFVIASSNTSTDNEQVSFPVVLGQSYFVVVSSVDARPTTYSLEIENFAAPLPTAIDLDDNHDTGRSNTDNVTFSGAPELLIHADLSDFDLVGIPILTSAQAAAGNVPGVAVEVFRNGVSLGFADPLVVPDLFTFTPTVAQLLGGLPTGSPVGPVASDAFGYQNLFTAAVRVFDGQSTTRSGRTTATARLAVTYDANVPDATLASMEMLAASDSNVARDLVTNINQPAFWGVAEANSRVRIYASRDGRPFELVGVGVVGSDRSDEAVAGRTIGGRVVSGLPNDGLGVWEVTVEPLADGTYTFRLTLEDVAGNESSLGLSGAPEVVNAVVDTLPPQRPTIDLLDADDTGRSRLDNVTIGGPTLGNGVARFRISAEPGSSVFVKDGEVVIATFLFNAAFDLTDGVPDGFGLLTVDFVANQGVFGIPAEGPHPLSVESFDLAGNRSAQAEELLVSVDFTRPAPPSAPDLAADSDTGLFDTDNVTALNRPVLLGTGEANATVRVFARNVVTGAVQWVGTGQVQSDESDGNATNGIGIWQVTIGPLDDGVYDLEAELEDQAGNISLRSVALRVEIDTTVPNTAFIDLVEADDTGRHNDDNITRVGAPRFTLTTEDPNASLHTVLFPGGENLRYRLFDRTEGGAETLIFDSLVALGGLTPLTLVGTGPLALADGVHNLKLEVEDRAGNISQDFLLTVVIDRAPPPVSILGILQADTGIAGYAATFTDRVTSDTGATFVGRAEADAIVRLYVDGRRGINDANGTIDNPAEFALTVAEPFDGDDAQPNGQWSARFIRDLNDATFFDFDGVREVLVTAEDVAGNVSAVQVIRIFVDTQGPVVSDVRITSAPAFDLFDPKPSQGPTPLVRQLSIFVSDNPARSNLSPSFLFDAVFKQVAENPGLYEVRGDANGLMPIDRVDFLPNPPVPGAPATGVIRITFARPLPDDRFTLTISDLLADVAGNKLDGQTNTAGPLETPVFPSGDGQSGGNFVARFTVDSRPEIGTWAAGTMWIDTNGNGVFDPENPDFVNRDITYAFGLVTDDVFAGNFSPTPTSIADGFDKLAVFGRVGTTFRWLIDTDNDGAPDITKVDPTAVNGTPIAGNFDGNAANGDEVGLFDGQRFFLDTDHDFEVNDFGGSFVLTTTLRGYPVVGDFNGDGLDDLATWKDDTFFIDLAAGPGPLSWDGVADFQFRFGFITTRDRPVVADMDGDGFADLGLWVPDRHGVSPLEGAEWYWLVSAGAPVTNRIRFDTALGRNVIDFTPTPLGPDLYFRYGQPYAMPVVGNFDPPLLSQPSKLLGLLAANLFNVFDVDVNFVVNTQDAVHVLRMIATRGSFVITAPAAGPPLADVNMDGTITNRDALDLLRHLAQRGSYAYGEGEGLDGIGYWSPDVYFSELGGQNREKLLRVSEDEYLFQLLALDR